MADKNGSDKYPNIALVSTHGYVAADPPLGARRDEAVPAVLIDGNVGLLDTDLPY